MYILLCNFKVSTISGGNILSAIIIVNKVDYIVWIAKQYSVFWGLPFQKFYFPRPASAIVLHQQTVRGGGGGGGGPNLPLPALFNPSSRLHLLAAASAFFALENNTLCCVMFSCFSFFLPPWETHPSFSHLPYTSRPLSSRVPAPPPTLSPSTVNDDLTNQIRVFRTDHCECSLIDIGRPAITRQTRYHYFKNQTNIAL